MNKTRTALLIGALILLGISGAASAGGYGKGHYDYAPAGYGGYYTRQHVGYRHGYRKGYRHGYRHGHYRKGYRYGYRHGYRSSYRHGYHRSYRRGYRHGYRSKYRYVPYGYYYRHGPYRYSPHVTLRFDF